MTLDELSRRSEVSISLLSQLERDKSMPTVTTLERIVNSLGMTISELFASLEEQNKIEKDNLRFQRKPVDHQKETIPQDERRFAVVHKNERKKLILPREEAQYELLTPDLQRKIQFITVTFPPGAKITKPFTHRGEECGVILKGKLKGIIGDQEVVLEQGDSIYLDSTIPHRWENAGETEMKAVWVITPPSF